MSLQRRTARSKLSAADLYSCKKLLFRRQKILQLETLCVTIMTARRNVVDVDHDTVEEHKRNDQWREPGDLDSTSVRIRTGDREMQYVRVGAETGQA